MANLLQTNAACAHTFFCIRLLQQVFDTCSMVCVELCEPDAHRDSVWRGRARTQPDKIVLKTSRDQMDQSRLAVRQQDGKLVTAMRARMSDSRHVMLQGACGQPYGFIARGVTLGHR